MKLVPVKGGWAVMAWCTRKVWFRALPDIVFTEIAWCTTEESARAAARLLGCPS